MAKDEEVLYKSCISCTQQFKHCGNAFRCDTYKGCSFGCTYCFANSRNTSGRWEKNKIVVGDIKSIERLFNKAFETGDKAKNYDVELLRHNVPLHVGGMADPFQHIEFSKKGGNTKKLIELSNKYDYPLMLSTKVAHLPKDYWDLLDPSRHAFQISLIGFDEDFVAKFETNTPTPQQRLDFVKELRSKGFWVSVRIQPLIDLTQAMKIVDYIKGDVSYITVEHLKLPVDNHAFFNLFKELVNEEDYYTPKHGGRNYEVIPLKKEHNFNIISKLANSYDVKVGCGDNDLHHLTQSRCCCGIDTVGEKFDNYLKYNLTYFMTGKYNLDEIWMPEIDYRVPFHTPTTRGERYRPFKEFTKDYILKNKHLVYASGKIEILKDLDPCIPVQKSLFKK